MDNYNVYYDGSCIACYCRDMNSYKYRVGWPSVYKDIVPAEYLRERNCKKPIKIIEAIMTEENRVKGTRKLIYESGHIRIVRKPDEVGCFYVYLKNAKKGQRGYSPKNYSAPHYEGENTPDGMTEWASEYGFTKFDDGTFEAFLDENWWWGGGHNDGGTIHTEVPEEYFDLPYDAFLEKVVTVAKAAHYGFEAEELKNCEGLKEFFGFE